MCIIFIPIFICDNYYFVEKVKEKKMELPAISSMKNSFIAFEWEVSMRKKRDENYLISFINYPAVAPSFFF